MHETLARRSDRHARRRGLVVLVALVVLLALVAGGLGGFYSWATGASGPQRKVDLIIPSGATGAQVADLLKANGVIRSTLAFRILAKFRHQTTGFRAGQYTSITTNMTVAAVLDALKGGPFVKSLRVGFPEGLTVAQIAAVFAERLNLSNSKFIRATKSGAFTLAPYLPPHATSLEGFLFPDTYDFLQNTTEAQVIQKLLGQFQVEAQRVNLAGRAQALQMTPYQMVIVASMIEREARCSQDRPKIAAVVYNRLKKGMALEIDAAVEYALAKYKDRLTTADLKVRSPYNTYLHTGLPPTPIASPGFASLDAAANPAKANYLYYVLYGNSGCHYFTVSYQDFLKHKSGG